jgi:hypothetical protein
MKSSPYSSKILINLEFTSTDFREILKFNENSSSRSRVVACGRKDGRTDGRRNITKLTVTLPSFGKAAPNYTNDIVQSTIEFIALRKSFI